MRLKYLALQITACSTILLASGLIAAADDRCDPAPPLTASKQKRLISRLHNPEFALDNASYVCNRCREEHMGVLPASPNTIEALFAALEGSTGTAKRSLMMVVSLECVASGVQTKTYRRILDELAHSEDPFISDRAVYTLAVFGSDQDRERLKDLVVSGKTSKSRQLAFSELLIRGKFPKVEILKLGEQSSDPVILEAAKKMRNGGPLFSLGPQWLE